MNKQHVIVHKQVDGKNVYEEIICKHEYGDVRLNTRLATRRNLLPEVVDEICLNHGMIQDIKQIMENTTPDNDESIKELSLLADSVTVHEFELQRLWGFEQDSNMHSQWFTLPHCDCPIMDNADRLGTKYKVINTKCILHGKDNER